MLLQFVAVAIPMFFHIPHHVLLDKPKLEPGLVIIVMERNFVVQSLAPPKQEILVMVFLDVVMLKICLYNIV